VDIKVGYTSNSSIAEVRRSTVGGQRQNTLFNLGSLKSS